MPKKSVPIELGGKTRHLRYDFNALVALEETLNIPISEIGKLMSGSVKIKDLRSIFWAGLIHEDNGITANEVGEWLDFSILGTIAEKVALAFEAAIPDIPGDSKNKTSPQKK